MQNQKRFLPLTILVMMLLVGAVLLLPNALQAHASPKRAYKALDPNPVGVWAVTLRSDGTEQQALALFEKENGYIETDTQPGVGVGAWKMTTGSTLEAIFVRGRSDGGILHLHLMARFLSPTHYSGQEEMVQYAADGHVVRTLLSLVDATFVPHTDPNWFF